MRASKTRFAHLALIAALLPVSRLHAAAEPGFVGDISGRVRHIAASLLGGPGIVPQAVAPADSQGGGVVNPAHLDQPAQLERELRASLRKPIQNTRLTVTGGTARLGHYSVGSAETVHGHVVVLKGDADVHGRVEGNLVALDGDITVEAGAMVVGDVLAIGGHVNRNGGTITGTVQELEASDLPPARTVSAPEAIAWRAAGLLGVFLTLTVLGFGLVTFGRPNLEIVSDTVAHSFGRSFLAGLLGQILVLPTFGMLLIGLVLTIAGVLLVPFAAVVFALLVIMAIFGGVLAVAHAMGETITRRQMARGVAISPNSYRYTFTGLGGLATVWIAWVLFGWVPVAGGLIFAAAALATWAVGTVGFGAALLSRGGIREQFAGRLLPAAMMTDEYLWATPQFGVPSVQRPPQPPIP